MVLFSIGIGAGLFKNNFKKSNIENEIKDNSLLINKNINSANNFFNKDDKKKSLGKSKNIFLEKSDKISFSVKEITSASPSLDQIKYLINTWLFNKSKFLAGKSEIDISKIVQNDLVDRLNMERKLDIQKGIYKNIKTNIENIVLVSQTASRIAVLVDLEYTEKIFKKDGEFINETTFTPFLKVKYILGFSNNSWKLVDYISGV